MAVKLMCVCLMEFAANNLAWLEKIMLQLN